MYSISAVLILDSGKRNDERTTFCRLDARDFFVLLFAHVCTDGERIASKFYTPDLPTLKEQNAFEKALWQKTYRANGSNKMFCFVFGSVR
jgi:hypothetical protein